MQSSRFIFAKGENKSKIKYQSNLMLNTNWGRLFHFHTGQVQRSFTILFLKLCLLIHKTIRG